MATILPFRPYRYSPSVGPLGALVTQPYDKITPDMQARYLAQHPHNLVRIILGERFAADNDADNVYTRATRYFNEWIAEGVFVRDSEPSLYAYFQEFCDPDTGDRFVRKGFIGRGPVEEYSAGVVFPHERTHSGPKKDRMELLKHTMAHFEQLFLMYSDPKGEVDRILDQAAAAPPDGEVTDEYQAVHRIWRISDPQRIAAIQRIMADKRLLIADGHHRYETAVAFRAAHPELQDARAVQMTFVNMNSPGLKILATHRLMSGLPGFDPSAFIAKAGFKPVRDLNALRAIWKQPDAGRVKIGVALAGIESLYLYETAREPGGLDVRVLQDQVIGKLLGVDDAAVRDEKHIGYMRGVEPAIASVRNGIAQVAFLLEPTSIDDVARIAFSGGVMPQKSTDFYPKLLSGLTIYRLEK